jgi:uncharacterized protein involved in exopolysaccharide biosynthesis
MTIANDLGSGLGVWNDRRTPIGRMLRREDRNALRVFLKRALLTSAVAWLLAALYLMLTPVKYVSKWTLILPTSNHSATFSLESIGQATTTANAPGSASLSPKVVYKEIADSDQVRSAAAASLGMTFAEFGRPRVKLIDETALMMFEIGAASPEVAQKKAVASIAALNHQLEALRKDEVEKRSTATTLNLKSYQEQVNSARQRITDTQLASGLVSVSQFNEIVAGLGATRRRLTELSGDLSKQQQEQARLIERIGIGAGNASIALRLAANPALVKVINDYADATAAHTAEVRRLGPENPVLINIEKRRAAAREQLRSMMAQLNIGTEAEGRTLVMMTNLSHQAELLQQLVRNEAAMDGKRREVETITLEKERFEDEVTKLSGAASRLEDLKKDHQLAEAVYSSAVARVDTSKSDIYGAYPIVQVLAPPNLPESYEQPRRLYAAIGGMVGTFFSFLAWGLAWLYSLQMTKLRKKPLSTA